MPHPQSALDRIFADYAAARNSGSAEAVASFYAEVCSIVINRGTPWQGRNGVAEMAAGFFAEVPDLALTCDEARIAGDDAIFVWTLTGHDALTGHPLEIREWEAWRRATDGKIAASAGWFDAEAIARQAAGG